MSPPNLWYLPPAFFSAGGPWGRRAPGLSCALDCRGLSVLTFPGHHVSREGEGVSRCERLGEKSGTCEPRRSVSSSLIGYRPRRARWRLRRTIHYFGEDEEQPRGSGVLDRPVGARR